jgi:hypothetical protein
LIYSGDQVLSPSLNELKTRNPKEGEKQLQSWQNYKSELDLFNTDPNAYFEKNKKEVDVNDLFSSFLEEEPKDKSDNKGPSKPVDLIQPELLEARTDLWIAGHSLIPVDHGSSDFEPYPIQAPKAFSETISAQGMVGMFKKEAKKDMSIYSPMEYGLIPVLEILFLQLIMFLILLVRVNRKN